MHYPSICLSIYLSICLSEYLPIYLSTYLPIYLLVYVHSNLVNSASQTAGTTSPRTSTDLDYLGLTHTCCGLHVCILPKFICWSPIPWWYNIKKWSLWDLVRPWKWSSHDELSAFIRRERREPTISAMWASTRRLPSISQGEGFHYEPSNTDLLILDFQPQNSDK
jgi:hypothetical protein